MCKRCKRCNDVLIPLIGMLDKLVQLQRQVSCWSLECLVEISQDDKRGVGKWAIYSARKIRHYRSTR